MPINNSFKAPAKNTLKLPHEVSINLIVITKHSTKFRSPRLGTDVRQIYS